MIDTDKYEGHTEGPWIIETWRDGRSVYDIVRNDDKGDLVIANVLGTWEAKKPNMKLIADAPLLLAEVKRLHNHIRRMRHWAEPKMHEIHHDGWRKLHEEIYEGGEEE